MYTNHTTEQNSFAIDVEETFVFPKEKKRVFQDHNNRQMLILDIEQYIPEHHIARAVDEMVESISDSILEEQYVGGGRMLKIMNEVFEQFLLQLIEEWVIDLQHLFVDGTKIEANASLIPRIQQKTDLENE